MIHLGPWGNIPPHSDRGVSSCSSWGAGTPRSQLTSIYLIVHLRLTRLSYKTLENPRQTPLIYALRGKSAIQEVFMQAEQSAFPFRFKKPKQSDAPNTDLIGRSYVDDHATVTVVSVCLNDDKRVLVERDLDGRQWSMPAWLMRLIFLDTEGKRAA